MKTVISILIVLIALSFITYWYSSEEIQFDQLSLSFFSASISVFIAVMLINYYLDDKNRKHREKFSNKIIEVLSNKFCDLFHYIDFITDPPGTYFWPKIGDKVTSYELYQKKLREKSQSKKISIHPERFEGLLDGEIGWGKYYENAKHGFDALETKYLEFIDPEIFSEILEVERTLMDISNGIKIIQDSMKRGEDENNYIKAIKEYTEEDHKKLFSILARVVKTIDFFEICKGNDSNT